MTRISALVTALAMISNQAARPPSMVAPPLRAGSATIQGHVFDAIAETPVAGVEVRLMERDPANEASSSARRLPRTAIAHTDADGAFIFTKIGAGSYGIIVTGKTHLPACFGSTRQLGGPCATIDIADGQVRRDDDIFVRPAAIIRGRVVDHEGQAVTRANVHVLLVGRDQRIGGISMSEADGRFEIGGLAPAQVTVVAEVMGRNGEGLLRAYYPGVQQLRDAQPINLDVGPPIDIELRMPKVVIGSINAHVAGPQGFRLDKYVLFQPGSERQISLSTVDDGEARVLNLREGRYVIEARGVADGRPLTAFATIDVGDGETEVPIQLEEAGAITGRIIAERGGVPPTNGVRIAAAWILDGVEVDPDNADEAPVAADGSFSLDRLFGTRLFKVTGLDAGWRVVSIRAERTDITASAFNIAPASRTQLIVTVGRQ